MSHINFEDLSSYLENMQKQNNATKEIFNIDENEDLLRLSDRHYLILKGKLSKPSSPNQSLTSSQSISEEVTFSSTLNRLVRLIISKFSKKNKRGGNNFLFYIIKEANKTLTILVALSGFGKAGKKGYSDECKKYQNNLEDAIRDIQKIELRDYNIKGKFVPFSINYRNINTKEFYIFDGMIKEQLEYINKEKSIKAKLIVKLLNSKISYNLNSFKAIGKFSKNLPTLLKTINKIQEIAAEIKAIDKSNPLLIESLTLDFLNRKLTEQKKSQSEDSQFILLNLIKKNADYLKNQGDRIFVSSPSSLHFQKYKENFKILIDKYQSSLNYVLEFIDNIDNFDILRYAAHCSEDNLIDYLSYANDFLKGGIHYIFNVDKSSVKDNIEEISLRPPCIHCIIYFPLAFQLIIPGNALLPVDFEKHSKLKVDSIFDAACCISLSDMENYLLKNLDPFTFFMHQDALSLIIAKGNMSRLLNNIQSRQTDFHFIKFFLTKLFWHATNAGSIDIVNILLKQGERIENIVDEKFGYSPVHTAVLNAHYEIVEAFLDYAKTEKEKLYMINKKDRHGFSTLQHAALRRRPKIFKLLLRDISLEEIHKSLKSKPTVPKDSKWRMAMIFYYWNSFFAVTHSSDIETLEYIWDFFKNKIKPEDLTIHIDNPKFSVSMTPLHVAVIKGNYEVVKFLIDKGFLIDGHDAFLSDYNGDRFDSPATALNLAIRYGYEDISTLLLTIMKSNKKHIWRAIETKATNGCTLLHWLSEYGLGTLIKNEVLESKLKQCVHSKAESNGIKKVTSLHLASIFGHEKIVGWLLENTADLFVKDEDGFTPLHFAAQLKTNEVASAVNDFTKKGYTPLHLAATYGHLAVVKALLEKGANIKAKNKYDGGTPLDDVRQYCSYEERSMSMILFSTEKLFDHVKKTSDRRKQIITQVKNCIDNGAVVNAQVVTYGARPLHYCAQNGYVYIARVLLENGADPNVVLTTGATPLHYAAKFNNFEIVKLLLEKGADYYLKTTKRKRSPLDVAKPESEAKKVLLNYIDQRSVVEES